MKTFTAALCLLLALEPAAALTLWEAGRLDYINGSAEVAAFVNGPQQTQLQAVLCAKDAAGSYRLSLLLPHFYNSGAIFETWFSLDNRRAEAYAELSGNSLEFQLDDDFYLDLAHSSVLTLHLKPEDAAYLDLPESLDLPLIGAGPVLREVARQCTALCLNENFQCRQGLLSALLWPESGFNRERLGEVDELCTRKTPQGYLFNFTDACRIALNRFYVREGDGPLSFLYQLFHDPKGPYQRFKTLWNDAVHSMPTGALAERGLADDREWYITLYALAGRRQLREYPQSYFDIINHGADPTTLLYDIESRYEMEGLKYLSVLMRRLRGSYQAQQSLEQALKAWADFYRRYSYMQPYILKAQALRPVMYRLMLQRIWHLAGSPQGLDLKPELLFRQGTGGRTVTADLLERKCAYFEGARGDEFFLSSPECVRAVRGELHLHGLITEQFPELKAAWDDFAGAWHSSIYASDSSDDPAGESLYANFALTLLTACRIYGFGDYFLLRQCISARDSDICSLERDRALNSLEHELSNRLSAIAAVSREDAAALSALHEKWHAYHDKLRAYTTELARRGTLPWWQALLVQAVSAVLQTNAVMSAPYYREELPDESLSSSDDDDFPAEDYPHTEVEDLSAQALDEAQQRQSEREGESAAPEAQAPAPEHVPPQPAAEPAGGQPLPELNDLPDEVELQAVPEPLPKDDQVGVPAA